MAATSAPTQPPKASPSSAGRPVGAAAAALALLVLLLAVAQTARASSGLPARVIPLTDASFEHDTQAYTGQTTGHWAVLLSDSSATKTLPAARTAAKALAALAAQRSDEGAGEDDAAPDPGCLYASVDASDEANPALAARFHAFLPGPVLLLFRDRQLFPLPLPRVALSQKSVERAGAGGAPRSDGEAVSAAYHAILDFLTGGFREVDSERIPPPGHGGGPGGGGASSAGGGGGGAAGLVSGLVNGAVAFLAAQKMDLDGSPLIVVGAVCVGVGLVALAAFGVVAVAVARGSLTFGNQEPPPAGSDPAAVPPARTGPRKVAGRAGKPALPAPAPVPEGKAEEEAEEVIGEGEDEEAEAEGAVAEAEQAEEPTAAAAADEEEEEEEQAPKEEDKEDEATTTTTVRRRRPGRA